MPIKPAAIPHSARPATTVLRDGSRIVIRPIQPADAAMERTFIEGLSPQSRRFRFLETLQSPSDSLLRQLTLINPLTDVAYVAIVDDGLRNQEVGVGRFSAALNSDECEFAIVVADGWRQKGLGTILMHNLVEAARTMGVAHMYSSDAWDNDLMRKFAAGLGLDHHQDPQDATQVLYQLELPAGAAAV